MGYSYRAPVRTGNRTIPQRMAQRMPASPSSFDMGGLLYMKKSIEEMLKKMETWQKMNGEDEQTRQIAYAEKMLELDMRKHLNNMKEIDALMTAAKQKIEDVNASKADPGESEDKMMKKLLAAIPDKNEIVEEVMRNIPTPKDGNSPDLHEVAAEVLAIMGIPDDGEVDEGGIVQRIIEKIMQEKSLTPEHVKGLPEQLKRFASQLKPGMGYVHGGGITRLTAGSNITITKLANGSYQITASSSGGSGFQVPLTGALGQGTFTWATAPNAIVVDTGRIIEKTSKNGEVNWTGTTTTVLTVFPNSDIYAIA